MATRKVETGDLAGVLLPNTKRRLWSAETTLTGDSPIAQRAASDSRMVVVGSGVPENEYEIELYAARGGLPIRDSAGFWWRENGGDWYGWETPNAVDRVNFIDTETLNKKYEYPHMVDVGDGTAVYAYQATDTPGRVNSIELGRRLADGSYVQWAIITGSQHPLGGEFRVLPRLVRVDDGAIEMYHLIYTVRDPGSAWPFSYYVNVRKWRSEDGGNSWAVVQTECLAERLSVPSGQDISDFTVAYGNGQYILFITMDQAENLYQYASRDGGNRFTRVETTTNLTTMVDCVFSNGFFIAAIAPDRTTGGGPWDIAPLTARTADPFRAITEWTNVSPGSNATFVGNWLGGLALATSEIGVLLVWSNAPDGVESHMLRSLDGGSTWEAVRDTVNDVETPTLWWHSIRQTGVGSYPSALGYSPTDYCAMWHRGALILIGGACFGTDADPAAGNLHRDFIEFQLGGYSTLTRPINAGASGLSLVPWDSNWYAWEQPQLAAMYNTAHVGVPTVAVASGNMNVQCAAGVTAYWAHGTTSAATAVASATMVASRTGGRLRLVVAATSGGSNYLASVSLSAGQVELYDEVAGAVMGTPALVDTSQKLELRIGIDASIPRATCWYRVRSDGGEARAWVHVDTQTPTSGGLPTWSHRLELGAAAGTSEADIEYIGANTETETTTISVAGLQLTSPSWGIDQTALARASRDFSSSPIYVHDGVSARALGVAIGRDTWTLTPTQDFKAEHLDPLEYPTPRRVWRSRALAVGYLAWHVNDNGEDERVPSQVLAVHLEGINFAQITLAKREASAWGAGATVDLWKLDGVSFDRYGEVLIPNSATVDTTYVQENELAGGFVKFNNGALRRIISNTAGPWYTTATERRASITIDGDGTELATGTIQVMPTKATIFVHTRGAYLAEGWRIQPAEAGPDGYYEIGIATLNGVQVFGDRPDTTRARVLEVNEEITEALDGSRYTTRDQPDRARWEISWVQSSMRALGQEDAPTSGLPYVQASEHASALPAATVHSTPLDVYGAISAHGRQPLVILPKIPQDDGAGNGVYVRSGWDAGLYGRVASQTVRLETADGLADTCGERVRLAVLTVEQET